MSENPLKVSTLKCSEEQNMRVSWGRGSQDKGTNRTESVRALRDMVGVKVLISIGQSPCFQYICHRELFWKFVRQNSTD